MNIRNMQVADRSAIRQLYNRLVDVPGWCLHGLKTWPDDEQIAQLLRVCECIVQTDDAGVLIGFLFWRHKEVETPQYVMLAVDPGLPFDERRRVLFEMFVQHDEQLIEGGFTHIECDLDIIRGADILALIEPTRYQVISQSWDSAEKRPRSLRLRWEISDSMPALVDWLRENERGR